MLLVMAMIGLWALPAGASTTGFEAFPVTTTEPAAMARIREFVEQSGDGTCGTYDRLAVPGGLSVALVDRTVRPYLTATTPRGQILDALDLIEAYEVATLVGPLIGFCDAGSLEPDLAARVLATAAPLADPEQRRRVDDAARSLALQVPVVELGSMAGGGLLDLAWKSGDAATLDLLERRARGWLEANTALARLDTHQGIPYRKVADWTSGGLQNTRWLLDQRRDVLAKPTAEQIEALARTYVAWNTTPPELVVWSSHELRAVAARDTNSLPAIVAAFRTALTVSTDDAVARARALDAIRYFGGVLSPAEGAAEAAAIAASPQGILYQLTIREVFPGGR